MKSSQQLVPSLSDSVKTIKIKSRLLRKGRRLGAKKCRSQLSSQTAEKDAIQSVCQCIPGWSLMSSSRVAQVKGCPLTKFILFSPSKGRQSLNTSIRTRQVRRCQHDGTRLCKIMASIQHLSHRRECDGGIKLKEILQHADSL